MQDAPRVYEGPRDPARPLACPGESSRRPVARSRDPLPARPGGPGARDCECVRNGVADVLVAFAPPECERHTRVTRIRARDKLARFCPVIELGEPVK